MYDSNSTPVDTRLAELLEESYSVDWGHVAAHAPERLPLFLAARFDYDVKQGGFAQLLYNMRGQCLGQIEDMLIAAEAAIAHEFYVKAIRICLGNKTEYRRFLVSNYSDANAVKEELQLLSLEYLGKKVGFRDEASSFLTRRIASP